MTATAARAWRDRAACREVDPELFFPVSTDGPSLAQVAEAQAVCALCTVSRPCLDWALENGETAGVWGGMSEDQRQAMRSALTRGTA